MSTTQPGFWIPSDSQAKMTLRKMAHDVNGAIDASDDEGEPEIESVPVLT